MIHVIKSFFLSKYENCDFIEQNKARVFLYYSLLMLILLGFIPLGYVVMHMPTDVAIRGGLGAVVIAGLVVVSLCILRTGKLNAAIAAYSFPTVLIVNVVRIMNAAGDHSTAFTAYIFYMIYLIVFLAAFGKRWHVPAAAILFIANNVATLYIVRGDEGSVAMANVTGFINGTLGMAVTAVSAYALVSLMQSYTDTLRANSDSANRKMKDIEDVIVKTRDGLDVGDSLIGEVKSMEASLESINARLTASKDRLDQLSVEIAEAKRANDEIVGASSELDRAGESYRGITEQASAAVNEMTASIQGISNVSTRSNASVEMLSRSISQGEEAASSAAESMSHLAGNADSLLSIVDVITGIAGQTNLLAMNAAIEAAHAGDSGKGFGVVADEIRRLAEETSQNIQAITEGLQTFLNDVGTAEKSFSGIGGAFGDISLRATDVAHAFEEIIAGLQDLDAGTTDIDRSVMSVVDSSSGMSASIRSVDRMVADNNKAIDSVKRLTLESLADLARISEGFDDILARAGKLRNLGNESGGCMSEMDAAIRKLKDD